MTDVAKNMKDKWVNITRINQNACINIYLSIFSALEAANTLDNTLAQVEK